MVYELRVLVKNVFEVAEANVFNKVDTFDGIEPNLMERIFNGLNDGRNEEQ